MKPQTPEIGKVIFLDIDGVLALNHRERDEYGSLFHPEFVENLRIILECVDTKIVISSTWRKDGLEKMQAMWKARRLPGEVIDTTPSIYGNKDEVRFWNGYRRRHPTPPVHIPGIPRGVEIEYWLKLHSFQRINYDRNAQLEYLEKSAVKNYAILDDDSDFLYNQREHYVQCSLQDCDDSIEGYGLTRRAAEKVVEVLTTNLVDLYYPAPMAFGSEEQQPLTAPEKGDEK